MNLQIRKFPVTATFMWDSTFQGKVGMETAGLVRGSINMVMVMVMDTIKTKII